MTRPPGPGYKEFFPAATRAAKDRALEREKAKTETPPLRPQAFYQHADSSGHTTPSGQVRRDEAAPPPPSSQYLPNGAASDTAHPLTDDAESLVGDAAQPIGSASSHESSNSVFSSSAMQHVSGSATKPHSTSITPLTNIDSPSYRSSLLPPTALPLASQHAEKPNGYVRNTDVIADGTTTPRSAVPSIALRLPARDPSRSVRGVACSLTFTDDDKKKAKPIFTEFGLVRTYTISLPWQRGGVISSIEATG
jgi:histone-lysine N-methyltransferase SETD1